MLEQKFVDFLRSECRVLNQRDWDAWVGMLSADFDYRILDPLIRDDPYRPQYKDDHVLVWESKTSVTTRIRRMHSEFAWAERPFGFQRRHITDMRLADSVESDNAGSGTVVESDVIVYRTRRPDETRVMSAMRRDLIIEVSGDLKLARRRVYLDLDIVDATHLTVIF